MDHERPATDDAHRRHDERSADHRPATDHGPDGHGGWRARLAAWRERMHANPVTRQAYRAGVGVAGALCMVGAVLTGWLPGPGGIPLFMLGLWVWSTEFDWAHGLMLRFKGWLDRYLALPAALRRSLVAGFLLLAVLGWYGWSAWQGLPDWLPQGAREQLGRVPGLDD